MIRIEEKEKCCGCGACANICPKSCISMEADEEGFRYPRVNADACVNCGACERVCPFTKTGPLRTDGFPAYAAKAKDDGVRRTSSSGGVFTLLARNLIKKGGVVYGCAMDEDCRAARHIRADDEEDLAKLRGSKYIQSDAGTVYRLVKSDLDGGRPVLFTGVPCQINALRSYLGRDYEGLYCAETICHGVPSQKLWEAYISSLEKKYGGRTVEADFRHKNSGKEKTSPVRTGDGVSVYRPSGDDPYMRAFVKNLSLRPSCYGCTPKKLQSMADLILGDFWGIGRVAPTMDDQKGVSLVVLCTQAGRRLFDECEKELVTEEADLESAVKFNASYSTSSKKPPLREDFFKDLNKASFEDLKKKYLSVPLKARIKKAVKKLTGKKAGAFEYGTYLRFKK